MDIQKKMIKMNAFLKIKKKIIIFIIIVLKNLNQKIKNYQDLYLNVKIMNYFFTLIYFG